MCNTCVQITPGNQKRVSVTLKLELQAVVSTDVATWNWPRTSARTICALATELSLKSPKRDY